MRTNSSFFITQPPMTPVTHSLSLSFPLSSFVNEKKRQGVSVKHPALCFRLLVSVKGIYSMAQTRKHTSKCACATEANTSAAFFLFLGACSSLRPCVLK